MVLAPVAPPVVAAKPIAPRAPAANSTPDDPAVTTWRDCMGRALQNYEQSHNLHALQVATGKLSGAAGGARWRGLRGGRTSDPAGGATG